MAVQEVITKFKSLDRNVIGKNEWLLYEIQTSAPSFGGVLCSFEHQPMRQCNVSDQGNAVIS